TPGVAAVLHLKTDDIYLDIKFTSWSSTSINGGGFSYERSSPAPQNQAPIVSISSPANLTSQSTPAHLTVIASAMDPDGSITGVQLFDGTTSLGSFALPPFSVTTDFYPGIHALTAVAIDNEGLQATSAVVSLTITSTPIANPIAARIPKGN